MNACLLQASRVLARCQAVLEVSMLCDSRRKSGLQQDGSINALPSDAAMDFQRLHVVQYIALAGACS